MKSLIFSLAALLLSTTTDSRADTLGRLFYTPAERANFDRMRQKGIDDTPQSVEPVAIVTDEPKLELDQVTVNGFVKRSNGKDTTWLNRLPHHESSNPQGILVLKRTGKASAVSVQLPSGKQVTLKAGQIFDVGAGTVREGYEAAPKQEPKPDVVPEVKP